MAKPAQSETGVSHLQDLRLLLRQRNNTLAWRHRVGTLLTRMIAPADRAYGSGQMVALATRLGKPASFANELYTMRAFAITFRRSEVSQLQQLTWSHMVSLISIEDPTLRHRLARRCLALKWTCAELRTAVQDGQGKRSAGGRPFKPLKQVSAATALRETRRFATLLSRYAPVWDEGLAQLRDGDESAWSDELLVLLQDAAGAIDELREMMKHSHAGVKELLAIARRQQPALSEKAAKGSVRGRKRD